MKSKLILLIITTIFMESNPLWSQNFEWVKSVEGSGSSSGRSTAIDAEGNVYTLGDFYRTVDFDSGSNETLLISNGITDIFIQKVDANGNLQWIKSIGSTDRDYANSMAIDDSGSVYLMGNFQDSIDLDPGKETHFVLSNGLSSIFILKLDTDGEFVWGKSFGGKFQKATGDIALDGNGNVYTSGQFADTVDFDPGIETYYLSSTGKTLDVFIQKMDKNGNFLWTKSMGSNFRIEPAGLTVDPSGSVLMTGSFEETVDFDPGPGIHNLMSNGGDDIFVQKLDKNGFLKWAKSFGGLSYDSGLSITTDDYGNVYTSGYFRGTSVDFDPDGRTNTMTATGASDGFIQKLDPYGNFIWAKSIGGAFYDAVTSTEIDASGYVYSSGTFEHEVYFEPGISDYRISSNGQCDIFIQKLSPEGSFMWAKTIGGTEYDYTFSLSIDNKGSIYTTGNYRGTVDFNFGSIDTFLSSTQSQMYLLKMNCDVHAREVQTADCSYTWRNGVTYTQSDNTATHLITNPLGCDSIITLDLTITKGVDIGVKASDTIISANNSNATYQWLDCDNNYAKIEGERSQVFHGRLGGNYAVELTENGCTDTSKCVSLFHVGLTNAAIPELKMYPNPANELVILEMTNQFTKALVFVYDAQGRHTQQYNWRGEGQLSIKTSTWQRGSYWIKILLDNGDILNRKLVKN